MRQTSGVIINNKIFLNPEHILKIKKYDLSENMGFWIEIFSTNNNKTTLTYDNKEERDNVFKQIISDICGDDYCDILDRNN